MRSLLLTSLLAMLIVSGVAQAHKVVASVWADGDALEGEVGFSNGDMAAAGTPVVVFSASHEKLGETVTDQDGLFRFTPTQAVPHIFRVDLGAGHVANVRVEVDELPVSLTQDTKPVGGSGSVTAAPPSAIATNTAAPELTAMIAKAVRREVKPLRKEIAAYKEKNDLQAILGGLGYICGIFGLAFFVYGRRSRHNDRGQA